MASKALPAQDVLLQLLRYDPDTGKLFWHERGAEWFVAKSPARAAALCRLWNERYAETEAFSHVSDGYKVGAVFGANYKAHRIIWKMQTGEDADQIDHINGDRVDNRWINLRNVSSSENSRNKRFKYAGLVVGVHRWAHNGSVYWVSKVPSQKATYHKCFGKAVVARRAAEKAHGFHENHGRAA